MDLFHFNRKCPFDINSIITSHQLERPGADPESLPARPGCGGLNNLHTVHVKWSSKWWPYCSTPNPLFIYMFYNMEKHEKHTFWSLKAYPPHKKWSLMAVNGRTWHFSLGGHFFPHFFCDASRCLVPFGFVNKIVSSTHRFNWLARGFAASIFHHQLTNKLKPHVILSKVTAQGLPGFWWNDWFQKKNYWATKRTAGSYRFVRWITSPFRFEFPNTPLHCR